MNTIFQPISPLWEAFPTSKPQAAESAASGSSIFADIFNTMVDNVRETEDTVAKNEYLLSTGQLDNPATLQLAAMKAVASFSILLVQIRDKVLNAYSELTRISV